MSKRKSKPLENIQVETVDILGAADEEDEGEGLP